jgi:phage terminase large subunit-like protein
MARPKRSLVSRCDGGSFLARQHHGLLVSEPLLTDPWLREAQLAYRDADSEYERREHAREFERRLKGRSEPGAGAGRSLRVCRAPLPLLEELEGEGEVERVAAFCARFLRHACGELSGEPLVLAPFQLEFVRELYRRDEAGRRLYQAALLGLPRGNGKTTLAAALGLYELCARHDHPQLLYAAATREQAQIAVDVARELVGEEGELADYLRLGKRSIGCRHTGGVLYALPGDGRRAHGLIPTAGFVDELWELSSGLQDEVYAAIVSSLHKRSGQAYLLATSTAPVSRRGKLWTIYQRALLNDPRAEKVRPGLRVLRDTDNGYLAWWYGAPTDADIDDPGLWRACNPAPWIRDRDLLRLRHQPGLTERDFRRLFLNQVPAR